MSFQAYSLPLAHSPSSQAAPSKGASQAQVPLPRMPSSHAPRTPQLSDAAGSARDPPPGQGSQSKPWKLSEQRPHWSPSKPTRHSQAGAGDVQSRQRPLPLHVMSWTQWAR